MANVSSVVAECDDGTIVGKQIGRKPIIRAAFYAACLGLIASAVWLASLV